jgi:arginine deiminase
MRERGVEVVEMHHLLTEAVKNPEAQTWIGERKIRPNTTGVGLAGEVRSWLDNLEPRRLAEFLIGGVVVEDVPD